MKIWSRWENKYDRLLPVFLGAVGAAMLLYECFGVDHFIGYYDGELYYSYLPEYLLKGNWAYFEKYPIGTALAELPFFLAAHAMTLLTDPAAADGYGALYDKAVGVSGIFYYLLGTFFLYQALKRLFDEKTALGIQVLLALGTALPLYATKYASFSHIKTYALAAAFLYLTLLIFEGKDRFLFHFLLGLLLGWIVIIRNINVFFVLFYLCYGITDPNCRSRHIRNVFSVKRLLPNLLGGLTMVLPQMILWKIATGRLICYSYEGETFSYLTDPKLFEVLFSDAKGLFMFMPLLFFAAMGLFCLKRADGGRGALGIVLIVMLELYTTAAWWCWWLGGVYGMRSFIDIFPFLAVCGGAFAVWLRDMLWRVRKNSKKGYALLSVFFTAAVFLCCFVNFAFLKGMQDGVVSETFATWWQLQEALRRALVF